MERNVIVHLMNKCRTTIYYGHGTVLTSEAIFNKLLDGSEHRCHVNGAVLTFAYVRQNHNESIPTTERNLGKCQCFYLPPLCVGVSGRVRQRLTSLECFGQSTFLRANLVSDKRLGITAPEHE